MSPDIIRTRRRTLAAASAFLVCSTLAHHASAAPEPEASGSVPPVADASAAGQKMERIWYGWQTLLLDAGALGAMGAAAGARDPSVASALAGISLSTYALGPPIVHAFHGNGETALKSGGMRLFLPPAAAFAGAGIGGLVGLFGGAALGAGDYQTGPVWGGFVGLLVGAVVGGVGGFGVGYVGAVVVDASKFSYEEAPAIEKQALAPKPAVWTVEPRVSLSAKGGAQIGIGGAF